MKNFIIKFWKEHRKEIIAVVIAGIVGGILGGLWFDICMMCG